MGLKDLILEKKDVLNYLELRALQLRYHCSKEELESVEREKRELVRQKHKAAARELEKLVSLIEEGRMKKKTEETWNFLFERDVIEGAPDYEPFDDTLKHIVGERLLRKEKQ